jgi:DNA-binding MarR family transcriptional regulator
MTKSKNAGASSALSAIHQAVRCASALFQKTVGPVGITPTQYAILFTVAKSEGLIQTDITDQTGIDRSTVTSTLRRLVEAGLLKREPQASDARARAVSLTPVGAAALRRAVPLSRQVDRLILAALPSARDRDNFNKDLGAVARLMSKEQPTRWAEKPVKQRRSSRS